MSCGHMDMGRGGNSKLRGKIDINSKDDMEGSMQLFMAQYPMPSKPGLECN